MWKLKTSFSTVSVIYFLMQQTIFCCEMYFYLLVEGWKKKKNGSLHLEGKNRLNSHKDFRKILSPQKITSLDINAEQHKNILSRKPSFFFSHKEREGHCYNLFTRSSLQFLSNWIPVLGSKLFDELPEFFIFGGPPVTSRAALRLIWACLGLLLHGLYTSETWKLFDLLH